MLKNLAQFVLTLILLLQVSPVFASSEFSTKRFLACESKILKQEKISIALDKEQKEEDPNIEKISSLESNIVRLERFTDKYCTGFTAQASNF